MIAKSISCLSLPCRPLTAASDRKWRTSRLILRASSKDTQSKAVEAKLPNIPLFAGGLFAAGATLGPLLDLIFIHEGIIAYDSFPLSILDQTSSYLVPPLFGSFYLVLGGLFPILDSLDIDFPFKSTQSTRDVTTGRVILSFVALACLCQLTAWMFEHETPYLAMHAVLSVASIINWRVFDGSVEGLVLACLTSVGVEFVEWPILEIWAPWHYTRPDVLGIPSFMLWCNFFYTPAIGNLARKLIKSDA